MRNTIIRRRLAKSAASVFVALVLSACGGGGGGDGNNAAALAALAAASAGNTPPPVSPPAAVAPREPVVQAVPVVQAKCAVDTSVMPSYEEQRLPNKLAASDALSFSQQLLQASGFDRFGPAFAATLCSNGLAGASTYDDTVTLLHTQGLQLWQAALDRVQGRVVQGTLSKSDDRMLYWARLTMTLALRQWKPDFPLSDDQRAALQVEFEKASRGQLAIDFPEGPKYKRILVSGFDPFTLGRAGTDGNLGIRIGNPSGATILSLDGHTVALADGTTAVIRTFILPVDYGPFIAGMQEDAIGPWFKPGLKRVDASVSMSQGRYVFDLEHYNGRYHFANFVGNDNLNPPCAAEGSFPAALDCDIFQPDRWAGYAMRPWQRDVSPQFTVATLPFDKLIAAGTGTGITNQDTNQPGGWAVERHDAYTVGPCTQAASVAAAAAPANPLETNCALQGSGGNYLSNASAYRNTLMRDTFKLNIPAGHIHTPVMTVFGRGSDSKITDATFESHRDAIVAQARNLVIALANSLATP